MKKLSIEEYISKSDGRREGSMSVIAARIIKEFLESGYEACEVTDDDIKRKEGYISTPSISGKKVNYTNASYVVKALRTQTTALQADDMVEVTAIKGHVFLARKEML